MSLCFSFLCNSLKNRRKEALSKGHLANTYSCGRGVNNWSNVVALLAVELQVHQEGGRIKVKRRRIGLQLWAGVTVGYHYVNLFLVSAPDFVIWVSSKNWNCFNLKIRRALGGRKYFQFYLLLTKMFLLSSNTEQELCRIRAAQSALYKGFSKCVGFAHHMISALAVSFCHCSNRAALDM